MTLKKHGLSTGHLICLFLLLHIAAVGYAVTFLHPYYGSNDEFTLAAIASGAYGSYTQYFIYLIGPAEVIEGAKKVHDFLTVGAAAPLQEAAVTGLNFPETYYEELLELYTKKRDRFLKGLDQIGLKHNVPQGTYFVMIDIQEFLDLPQFAGFTDLEFCEWMIKNIGVAAVPGSSFFREEVNHLIRLHFAREEKTLDEALVRLEKLKELL